MNRLEKLGQSLDRPLKKWVHQRYTNIAIFNFLLIFLFLLHQIGYFSPYFPISVNVMFMIILILAATLLGVKSSVFFIIALTFWAMASALRIVNIEPWVERTGIYVFEALFVGVVLLLVESLSSKKRS